MVSRRLIKATQEITRATNAIGTRLIDENLLLPREIQMKSASARAIVQAIAEGVTNPLEAVERATDYARHRDMPDREETYQRLLEALTALPDVSVSARRVLKALLKDMTHFERQCLIYHHWMDELLRKLSLTYPDSRTVTGVDIVGVTANHPRRWVPVWRSLFS